MKPTEAVVEMKSGTTRWVWRAGWLLWGAVIVAATTTPWSDFQGHTHWDKVQWIPFQGLLSAEDMVSNVLLFVPFGFLWTGSRITRRPVLTAVLLGAALSVSVELFQSFGHQRIPSATDVVTNLLGVGLGAELTRRWLKSAKT